jgi:hypothetical protein
VPPTGEAVAAEEDDEEEDGGRQGHGHDGQDGRGSGGGLGGSEETVTKKQQLRHSLFDPCRLAHSSSLLSAATVVVEGARPEEGARRPKAVVVEVVEEVEGGRPQTVSTQGPATFDQKDMFTLLSQ